jgi:hypothetical protein
MIIEAESRMVLRDIGEQDGGPPAAGLRGTLHVGWQDALETFQGVVGKAAMGMDGTRVLQVFEFVDDRALAGIDVCV